MKNEEKLKKVKIKKKANEKIEDCISKEERDFLDREEKLNKINDKRNQPILSIAYLITFMILGLMVYMIHFLLVEKDDVVANAANPRLDTYASNMIRGEILTKDEKVIATNKGNQRYYPYDALFAHACGFSKYSKAGVELIGNFYLLESHAPITERFFNTIRNEKNKGDSVVTTLEYDLQKTAYDALGNANGAVVVLEADTGKILSMVSKPDFNPNNIDQIWADINKEDSESSVLLNRATQGQYSPGSTFKILTALSYMRQYPKEYKKYEYDCKNKEEIFHGVKVHCYQHKLHGTENLEDAIANSCNQAFADIGIRLDVDEWRKTLESFLFNKSLPYQDASAISHFYLDGNSNKGYIPQTAIGQGDTSISPLHNAMIVQTIANGGLMMKPYIIDRIENYEGDIVKKFSPSMYDTPLTEKEVKYLTKYMEKVVEEGTASSYFQDIDYKVAGKTGTAEYANGEHEYSWFVGFSSLENPDIVVSVLVEQSDVNGIRAANIARQILDTYYK